MMKKMILVAVVLLMSIYFGMHHHVAEAGKGPCPDNCRLKGRMVDEGEAHNKFLIETKEIRKEIMVTRAKMRELMNSEESDTAKVGELAGHLFDLKEKLRAKRDEYGLSCSCNGGKGCNGDCNCGNKGNCRL